MSIPTPTPQRRPLLNTSRYPFPDLNTLPEDIRARILEVQEKAGFIPNVFLAFARRPAKTAASRSMP